MPRRTTQPSNWRFRRQGFSLIEVLLAIFLIVALTTILFSASGTLFTSRNSRLQTTAAKVASKHIELLRNEQFTNLSTLNENTPGYGNCTSCLDVNDDDLAKLPNSRVDRTIAQYEASVDILFATVTVWWNEANQTPRQITLDTLIYKNGL